MDDLPVQRDGDGFGGVVTRLTEEQADYINVPVDGPYKPETYRY